jgi:expansin (peptidoglycan-binding protein)
MEITAKIAAMTLMAAMVGVAAEPKQPQQKLTVYLRENARVPPEVRAPALDLANKMFATIGIRLDWRSGEPPRTSSLFSPSHARLRRARNQIGNCGLGVIFREFQCR